MTTVVGSMVPSRSVSFAVTSITTGVSSVVVLVSSTATGGSFSGLILSSTVASLDSWPESSSTVYLKLSVPL